MKKAAIVFAIVAITLYVVALLLPFDPDEQRPGTRLSGTLAESVPDDWSFVEPRSKVHVQTNTWYMIPHSVTTIAFSVDGELYIPCGWCETKRWPRNVARDANVLVRIDGLLYPRRAVKVTNADMLSQIFDDQHQQMDGVELYHMVATGT